MKYFIIAAFVVLGIIVISRVFAIYFINKTGAGDRTKKTAKKHSRKKTNPAPQEPSVEEVPDEK